MNLVERNQLIQEIFTQECFPILEKKGADYMRRDAWEQFQNLSEILDLSMVQILFVYIHKHFQALAGAMEPGRVLLGEPLEEKLKDIVNYALLMIAANRMADAVIPDEDGGL